jgi:hypothetical protein
MGHTLMKKGKVGKVVLMQYASTHQKVARLHSGNTITAQKYLRKLDKQHAAKNTKGK